MKKEEAWLMVLYLSQVYYEMPNAMWYIYTLTHSPKEEYGRRRELRAEPASWAVLGQVAILMSSDMLLHPSHVDFGHTI